MLADVQRIVGPRARLVRDDDPDGARFDILPLLIATDGAIAAFGRDRRRLRPNIVIGGVRGLEEREWPGHQIQIGDAIIYVDAVRKRCVMTTYDPDVEGILPADVRQALEVHVAQCERCAAFVASYSETPRIFRSATDVTLPLDRQIALQAFLRRRRSGPE